MLSDMDWLFAEQEAIMNGPSESVEDYLARRQRSRTSGTSYPLNPATLIPINFDDYADALAELRDYRVPQAPTDTTAKYKNASAPSPKNPPATTVVAVEPLEPARNVEHPHSARQAPTTVASGCFTSVSALVDSDIDPSRRKRKADDAGPQAPDRKKLKKSKSIDDAPTPTAASAAMAAPHASTGAPVGTTSEAPPAFLGGPSPQHEHAERQAEFNSPPAALAATAADARSPTGASASAGSAGKSELSITTSVASASASASSAGVHRDTGGKKDASGVRESSKADSGRRHDAPEDCSNITTPPSTAPEAVTASVPPVAKAASGNTKAPVRPREPARRVVAGRNTKTTATAAAQKPKQQVLQKGKGKGKKEKEPRYTPSEYAKVIQAQMAELQNNGTKGKGKVVPFLKGKRIYFHGGDLNMAGESTRKRMKLIVKHGGELLPEFDPERTTHIVCDDLACGSLLSAIKLKKYSDIPDHIPTVKWSWVVSGQGRKPRLKSGRGQDGSEGQRTDAANSSGSGAHGDADEAEDQYEYPMDWECNHALFGRIDAGRTPWGDVARMKSDLAKQTTTNAAKKDASNNDGRNTSHGQSSEDISHISDFTQDKVSPGPGDEAKIRPDAGLLSPPSSPRYPRPDPPYPHDRDCSAPADGAADTNAAGPSTASTTKSVVGSADDPLAEFYALARAERDAEWLGEVEGSNDGDESDTSDEDRGGSARSAHDRTDGNGQRAGKERGTGNGNGNKSKFACDDKNARARWGACPNQDVIKKLEKLKDIYSAKPGNEDRWRGFALSKAISALRKHPRRIRSEEDAANIYGIGRKTAQKIMEVIRTGDLRRIKFEETEDVKVLEMLNGIYNVGRGVARVWYNRGVRTLEDVAACKGGIKLTAAQMIGLKYYDDINTRIPREEVQEIYDLIQAEDEQSILRRWSPLTRVMLALRLDPKLFIRVMGSFRRGKADCGDIDVLITRPTNDGRTHRGILRRLLAELHKKGILTEDLSLPKDFEDLELVYHGLCRRDEHSRRRRIDFLTVPWKSRGAALLYYTGDDIFNRSMRFKANKMGYSLNQRGLHAGVIRDPSDRRKKLHDGKLIASESEEEIFDILGA